MKKIRLIIADTDDLFYDFVRRSVDADGGIEIVARACDGIDALRQVRLMQPDVFITELLLPGMDGLTLLRQIADTMRRPPLRIICSRFHSDFSIDAAQRSGVSLMLYKPVSPVSLLSTIHYGVSAGEQAESSEVDDKRNIYRALTDLNFSPKHSGTAYLAEAALLSFKNTSIVNNLTKGLYPQIAGTSASTPLRVERCIRSAIAAAYEKGAFAYAFSECPTNGEFIRFLVSRVKR